MGRALVLLACCTCAFGLNPDLDVSQYAHKSWTVREGFSKGSINTIAQTPDGYLWLGTEFGLLRFDGVTNVPWQPPPGQPLPSTQVWKLLAARDGTLWIGTYKGLASWKSGKLTQYAEYAGQIVNTLLEDREGSVWAGELGNLPGKLCSIQKGHVQCYGEDGSFPQGAFGLYEDSKGSLWAGVRDGLWRWKPGPPKFYPMPGEADSIRGFGEGDDASLLIGTSSGISRLVDGRTEAYPLPATFGTFRTQSLLRDREGGLWIGTSERGLVHVHKGRTDVFARSDGLSGDRVRNLLEDREGNVWVITNGGLDRFRNFAVAPFSARQGLSSAIAGSVLAARDGSVWLGTPGGLNRWNKGQMTVYRSRGDRLPARAAQQPEVREINNSGLPDDSIESLLQDDRGRIWVSTLRGAAYFEDGRFIPVDLAPSRVVHSISEDNAGSLWINDQEQGLLHWLDGRVVERIPWAKLGLQDHARVVVPDGVRGGLWLGFRGGGVAYFKDGQIRASYTAADGLGEGMVTGLRFDPDDTLWAATEGGLSRLKNGRIATLTSKNGLLCDAVNGLQEDDDRSFWLSTACGLVRIARSELDAWGADSNHTIQASVFDSSDGVRSAASSGGYSPQVAKSTDGKLWFADFDGASVIDPRYLPFNKLPPPVRIEQIVADRKTYATNAAVKLPPLTRDLEIDYTALSLVAPEKNRFRYKLEGHDSDWQDVGTRRQAFYSDLSPRNYRFRVIASNNSGVWNEAGASFDFSIAPAYYQTTWFLVSCAGAFFVLLWGLYRYRLYQVAREFNVRLEERVGERVRIARELHDTLLQTVQGLMLRLQVVDEMLPPGKAKEELEETLEVGDQAIIEGRNTVNDLRFLLTTKLPPAVRALGDELASESSATFRLVVEGPILDLNPIVRDELYRIAREALRNAFAHAKAKRIEAEITYDHWLFRLRIRDDGEGIPAEILDGGRSGHFGLAGMRERAKQIGWKLTIWSGAGAGTEIDVSVAGAVAYVKPPAGSRWRWGRKVGSR